MPPPPLVTPTPQVAEPAECAGSEAHSWMIGKAKWTKNHVPTPYARIPKPSASAPIDENPTQMFKCGIIFYHDDKPIKTSIKSYMQQVNISVVNLYQSLQHQLWELFAPELLQKEIIEALPSDPMSRTSLRNNKSVLDSQPLLLLVKQSTMKKPVQIDLIYEETPKDITTNITTTPASSRISSTCMKTRLTRPPSSLEIQVPSRQTCSINTQRSMDSDTNTLQGAADSTWALGGVAGKHLRYVKFMCMLNQSWLVWIFPERYCSCSWSGKPLNSLEPLWEASVPRNQHKSRWLGCCPADQIHTKWCWLSPSWCTSTTSPFECNNLFADSKGW